MRKIKALLGLGILVSIMPYLGFPFAIKNLLISLLGLGILYIAFLLYNINSKGVKEETFDNFSENNDFVEQKIENEPEQ